MQITRRKWANAGYAFLTGMLLMSCQHTGDTLEAPTERTATLKFNIVNYEQYDMPELMGEDDGQGVTRATGEVSALAHLAVGVFDEDGKCVKEILQDKGQDGYGNFSITLPYGEYTLVFMGYDGSHAVQLESPTHITFADNYVPNCFVKALPIQVGADTQAMQPVTLSRCVGCFQVNCSNGIPESMVAMNYVAEGGSTALNAMTGLADGTSTRTGTVDFSSVKDRTKTQRVNLYAFLPATQSAMQFTLSAVTADATVLRERTFPDVPMKIKGLVSYTGDFFAAPASTTGFSLSLDDTEWDNLDYSY